MNDIVLNKKIDNTTKNGILLYILTTTVAIINVYFLFNKTISYILIGFELLALVWLLLRKKIADYYGCYLVFLCTSIEYGYFVGNDAFYSFKNFRIMGMNLGIICLLPIFLFALFDIKRIFSFIKRKSALKKFLKFLLIINISAIIMGLIMLLINDNNILSIDNLIGSFLTELYMWFFLPWLIIISLLYAIINNVASLQKIKKYFVALIISFSISTVFSYFFSQTGYYGGVDTLIISGLNFLCPLFILLPFYGEKKYNKIIYTILTVASLLLILYFNSNGKTILLLVLTLLLGLILLFSKYKLMYLLIPTIIGTLVLIVLLLSNVLDSSILWNSKFKQVVDLLSFWKKDWFVNMSESPKARLSELLNTVCEYAKKPYFLVAGKGYMGSIKDHLSLFGFVYEEGGFSIEEWEILSFYTVHETLNGLFLSSGILGVALLINVFRTFVKNYRKSFYLMIGCIWFLLLYGYSVTLTAFGLSSLIIGLIDMDAYNEKCYI